MSTAFSYTHEPGQIIPTPREAQDRVLFGKRNALNRMLVEAGRRPDLCGMPILGLVPNELFSGGTTYLGRDVLLTSPQSRETWFLFSQAANYAVSPTPAVPPGWHRISQQDGVALVTRSGPCISVTEEYSPKAEPPRVGPPSGSSSGGH